MHDLSTRPLGGVLFPARIGMDRKFTRSVTSYIFFYYLCGYDVQISCMRDIVSITSAMNDAKLPSMVVMGL